MKETKKLRLGRFAYSREEVDGCKILSFFGIPYAAAERFGMPQKLDRYPSGLVNSGVGMRFPQNDVPPLLNFFLKNPMMRREILTSRDQTDENAFVLNSWTESTKGERPVLVFIHGGGFTYGSGTTPLYNGKYLAAKGIVVVTLNYRLSAPGFIPVRIGSALSVNRGFFDQQCALRWVRQNISDFGGDAGNITLMGQSAGGLSVSMHMLSGDSSRCFDKLIVCSGGANRCQSLELAEKLAEGFLQRNQLKSSEELLSLPWKKLIRLKMPLELLASPVVDGVFLKDEPANLLERAEFSPKPVMLGTTGDELEMVNNRSWYTGLGIAVRENEFLQTCRSAFGTEGLRLAEELRKEYQDLIKLQFKMREMPFHATALKELKLYARKATAYGYRMNYVPHVWNGLHGAYHCAELPFIFGTIREMGRSITKENLEQMKTIQEDWLSFLRNGSLQGRSDFGDSGQITLYENRDACPIAFPHRSLIEELEDSGLFVKLMKSFMQGRDENFIA